MSDSHEVTDLQPNPLLLKLFLACLLPFLICSCKNNRIEDQFQNLAKNLLHPSGIEIEYPHEGTLFPPEFPAPLFSWTDTLQSSTRWHIRFSTQTGKEIYRETVKLSIWRPDSTLWQNVKRSSVTEPVYLTIVGSKRGLTGGRYSSGRVSFSFSKDSVGASVFYRAVPLPFGYAVKNVHEIEWYSGSIEGGKPRKVLDNIPVCANCHSFSGNGLIAMDVDYANDKGSYIIAPLKDTVHLSLDKIITWSDYKRDDGAATYGLLSQVSPDGKYVLSTVKDRSVFVPVDNLEYSQLFFPVKGIIAVYDREKKDFFELPGASDKKYVQSNPNWSPDNSEILFSRANRYTSARIENSESVLLKLEDVEEFITGQKEFKFDIYRIPFNDGKGGKAVPVPGASNNSKSNFFARYSPDGKWIVFCQAENFMLLQPDSKLYIMPVNGGTPRLMNCNTGNMNSWHSWSPNSRWLIFSSKNKGPYTQLYLTHIDENGNDSPPVFLESMAFDKRAANIPEFFSNAFPHLKNMIDNFSKNAMYYDRIASLSIKDHEYSDALMSIDEAIKVDSTFYDAYKNRLYVNMILGYSKSNNDLLDRKIARRLINKEIQQNPGDESLYVKRGELRLLLEDYEGALQDGLYVLQSNPDNYDGNELLAAIYQKTGQSHKAITCLKKMLKQQPDITHVAYNLAVLYRDNNQLESALNLLNDIIDRYPNNAEFYVTRASLFLTKGDKRAAKADYDKAVSVDPKNYTGYRERGAYYMNNRSPDLARKDFDKAISLLDKNIKETPQNAPLYISRAEILEQTGNIQGALREYESYLAIWPLNYSVLKKKAQYYYSKKQWQQTIDTYTIIINNFPSDADVFCARGLAFQQAGTLQEALNDLNSAIGIDPDSYAYYFFRSRIKNQQGDKAGYTSDLKTSASLLKKLQHKRKLTKREQEILYSIQKQLGV